MIRNTRKGYVSTGGKGGSTYALKAREKRKIEMLPLHSFIIQRRHRLIAFPSSLTVPQR